MITCKEDLINTYIENDKGELRGLYLSIAKKFGFLVEVGEDDFNLEFVASLDDCKYVQDINTMSLVKNCKKLTLSDLKPVKQYAVLHKGGSYSFQSDRPIGNDVVACFDLSHSEKPLSEDFFDEKPRTKVEHEKVTESIFDLRPDFEAGELFYRLKLGDEVSFRAIESMSSLLIAVSSWNIYRRIETEIDERQAFIDAACGEIGATLNSSAAEGFARLYDSGKFKLVN